MPSFYKIELDLYERGKTTWTSKVIFFIPIPYALSPDIGYILFKTKTVCVVYAKNSWNTSHELRYRAQTWLSSRWARVATNIGGGDMGACFILLRLRARVRLPCLQNASETHNRDSHYYSEFIRDNQFQTCYLKTKSNSPQTYRIYRVLWLPVILAWSAYKIRSNHVYSYEPILQVG